MLELPQQEAYLHIPEGLTILIEAPQRWGKTLCMVMWEYFWQQEGRKIFSNLPLAFDFVPLDFREIHLPNSDEDIRSPFWNGVIGIDELNFWFNNRDAQKKENKAFSRFLLQQKKQGCHLIGTTHEMRLLDVNIRHHFDYLIRTECFPKHPQVPQVIKITITNGPLQPPYRKVLWAKTAPFLGLYDTTHTYNPNIEQLVDTADRDRPKRRPTAIPAGPESRYSF